jgi:hypothetical protein
MAVSPWFFTNNNDKNTLSNLALLKSLSKIDNFELVKLLNLHTLPEEKHHLLLNMIEKEELGANYFNQAIIVDRHQLVPKSKDIPPYWSGSMAKRHYGASKHLKEKSQYTTLANIIATNELGFTTEQMATLFTALMKKGVDFSIIDNSPYLDFITPKSGNNPLKSLIVSCLGEPKLQSVIGEHLAFLESIDEHSRHKIINNLDNFPYEAMKPAEFLLRLGHEHLAYKLYQLGATPSKQELRLACESFATTSHYEKAMRCILFLIEKLDLTSDDIEQALSMVKKATPEQFDSSCQRLLVTLKNEIKLDSGHSSTYEIALKSYQQHDYGSDDFTTFIKNLDSPHHPIIEQIARDRLSANNIGQGYFSFFYRIDHDRLAQIKFERMTTEYEASSCLETLQGRLLAKLQDLKNDGTGKTLMSSPT